MTPTIDGLDEQLTYKDGVGHRPAFDYDPETHVSTKSPKQKLKRIKQMIAMGAPMDDIREAWHE